VHHFNWWDSDSQLRVQSQRSFCLLELILSGRDDLSQKLKALKENRATLGRRLKDGILQ
jgi:hypothetical protein